MNTHTPPSPPLAIDLDGTLLRTDMLYESAFAWIRSHPWKAWRIPLWLCKGKYSLKAHLSENLAFDPALLPYNEKFLAFMRAEHARGRSLVLCTASHERLARPIARHLGLFDDVMASANARNLGGENKARALVERYGEKGFDYAGNSAADLAVWKHARKALVVNARPALENQVSHLCEIENSFPPHTASCAVLARAMRLHQWLKNLLLFIPYIAAHQFGDFSAWGRLLPAFLAFGLCASSVYIINDLFDLDSDRRHPRKRQRPLASGQLSLFQGILLAPALLGVSMALASVISTSFFALLCTYFVLTSAYSLFLKRILLLDCIVLAILYTVRIFAGALVLNFSISVWLLTFSIFLFLSLAFIKRYSELVTMSKIDQKNIHGRAYLISDLHIIQIFGISSAYTSVLVLALYMNSDVVQTLYSKPFILWFTIPVVIFWLSWIWIKGNRGEMHDDPLIFAIKDPASLVCGFIFFSLIILASIM